MKSNFFKLLVVALAVTFILPINDVFAQKKPKFDVAMSIYAGWMPWYHAKHSGIMKRWADKYGIEVNLIHMDYIASVEAFVAKKADGCVMTNMEALDMPAAAGIDCTMLILGDYSNGNDAIIVREGVNTSNIAGNSIYLVELSVSHYLLSQYLDKHGLTEDQFTLVNTNDSEISPAFISNKGQKVVVTWNPLVMNIMSQVRGAQKLYTSADIPGHILDCMFVRTDVLQKHPELGKALVGAWYEVMGQMSKRGAAANESMQAMANYAHCTLMEYKSQIKTTAMYWTPQSAADYTEGSEIQKNMDSVRQFCFKHGLLGEGASSVDIVGIQYPDGTIQGNKSNVKLRFDSSYMKLAAEGKL